MHQVGPIGEGANEGQWEPVADGLTQTGLIFHVVRQVRQRIALRHAALVGNGFVAAGKRNRLDRKERNALGIIERKLDDAAHLLVVDAVDQRDHWHDVHSVGIQVFNRAQLYVEQVGDFENLYTNGVD